MKDDKANNVYLKFHIIRVIFWILVELAIYGDKKMRAVFE